MLHRKFDDVFFPWIELTDEEIQELTVSNPFIVRNV